MDQRSAQVAMKEKALVQSSGFWGSVLSLLPAVSEAANWALGTGFIPPHIAPILVAVGAVTSIFGRVKADSRITSVLPK
jgi:hypothetical protein